MSLFGGSILGRSRRRNKNRAIIAGVSVAAVVAVGGGMALAADQIRARYAAPVSEQVQSYYDENKSLATSTARADTPLVSVIGDSYSGALIVGGVKRANWADVMKQGLAKDGTSVEIKVNSAGGSGYVNPGPTKTMFGQAVAEAVTPETDVIVFFGSRNDAGQSAEAVGAEAAKAYQAATAIAPSAKLLVIGPAWTEPVTPDSVLAIRDSLRQATEAANGTFVDPLEADWFQGDAAVNIGSDRVHPNESGHIYMAGLIQPAVTAALS